VRLPPALRYRYLRRPRRQHHLRGFLAGRKQVSGTDWDISDLGLVIEYDPHTISLSQHAFIDRAIERFGQNDVRRYWEYRPIATKYHMQARENIGR
jgi:hypothetical protein